MNQQHYHKLRSRGLGPGGLHCPCCTTYPPAQEKRVQARRTRRLLKQELNRAVKKENTHE